MAINLSGISLTSDVTGGGGVSGGVTPKMKFIPVTTLPPADEAKKTAVYLLPSKNTTTKNKYDEYVVLETASGFIWELFGQDVSVDLQSFATKTDLNKKQDKLVNQQNIRSINGIPLLGAGNIQLETLTTAEKNKVLELIVKAIEDAPTDGKQYARKDGEWSEVEAAGGGGVSAEETDEVAASVEESIMAQYGTSIAQLGHELSEIKESMGGGKTWDIRVTEDMFLILIQSGNGDFSLQGEDGLENFREEHNVGDYIRLLGNIESYIFEIKCMITEKVRLAIADDCFYSSTTYFSFMGSKKRQLAISYMGEEEGLMLSTIGG